MGTEMKLSEVVGQRRRRLDLTQKELAIKVMVSPSYVAMIETGERLPRYAVAARLADELLLDDADERANFLSQATGGIRRSPQAPTIHGRLLKSGADHATSRHSNDDNATLVGPDARSMRSALVTGAPILVVLCKKDIEHLNDPGSKSCIKCGGAVDPVAYRRPRPSVGRLVFSDGRSIDVNCDVAIGRGASGGDPIPESWRPVFFADPNVSRRHLDVVIEGLDKVYVHARSENPSELISPSGNREELKRDRFYPLPFGSTVKVTESVQFVFQSSEPQESDELA